MIIRRRWRELKSSEIFHFGSNVECDTEENVCSFSIFQSWDLFSIWFWLGELIFRYSSSSASDVWSFSRKTSISCDFSPAEKSHIYRAIDSAGQAQYETTSSSMLSRSPGWSQPIRGKAALVRKRRNPIEANILPLLIISLLLLLLYWICFARLHREIVYKLILHLLHQYSIRKTGYYVSH
jgi:hypothetical protein